MFTLLLLGCVCSLPSLASTGTKAPPAKVSVPQQIFDVFLGYPVGRMAEGRIPKEWKEYRSYWEQNIFGYLNPKKPTKKAALEILQKNGIPDLYAEACLDEIVTLIAESFFKMRNDTVDQENRLVGPEVNRTHLIQAARELSPKIFQIIQSHVLRSKLQEEDLYAWESLETSLVNAMEQLHTKVTSKEIRSFLEEARKRPEMSAKGRVADLLQQNPVLLQHLFPRVEKLKRNALTQQRANEKLKTYIDNVFNETFRSTDEVKLFHQFHQNIPALLPDFSKELVITGTAAVVEQNLEEQLGTEITALLNTPQTISARLEKRFRKKTSGAQELPTNAEAILANETALEFTELLPDLVTALGQYYKLPLTATESKTIGRNLKTEFLPQAKRVTAAPELKSLGLKIKESAIGQILNAITIEHPRVAPLLLSAQQTRPQLQTWLRSEIHARVLRSFDDVNPKTKTQHLPEALGLIVREALKGKLLLSYPEISSELLDAKLQEILPLTSFHSSCVAPGACVINVSKIAAQHLPRLLLEQAAKTLDLPLTPSLFELDVTLTDVPPSLVRDLPTELQKKPALRLDTELLGKMLSTCLQRNLEPFVDDPRLLDQIELLTGSCLENYTSFFIQQFAAKWTVALTSPDPSERDFIKKAALTAAQLHLSEGLTPQSTRRFMAEVVSTLVYNWVAQDPARADWAPSKKSLQKTVLDILETCPDKNPQACLQSGLIEIAKTIAEQQLTHEWNSHGPLLKNASSELGTLRYFSRELIGACLTGETQKFSEYLMLMDPELFSPRTKPMTLILNSLESSKASKDNPKEFHKRLFLCADAMEWSLQLGAALKSSEVVAENLFPEKQEEKKKSIFVHSVRKDMIACAQRSKNKKEARDCSQLIVKSAYQHRTAATLEKSARKHMSQVQFHALFDQKNPPGILTELDSCLAKIPIDDAELVARVQDCVTKTVLRSIEAIARARLNNEEQRLGMNGAKDVFQQAEKRFMSCLDEKSQGLFSRTRQFPAEDSTETLGKLFPFPAEAETDTHANFQKRMSSLQGLAETCVDAPIHEFSQFLSLQNRALGAYLESEHPIFQALDPSLFDALLNVSSTPPPPVTDEFAFCSEPVEPVMKEEDIDLFKNIILDTVVFYDESLRRRIHHYEDLKKEAGECLGKEETRCFLQLENSVLDPFLTMIVARYFLDALKTDGDQTLYNAVFFDVINEFPALLTSVSTRRHIRDGLSTLAPARNYEDSLLYAMKKDLLDLNMENIQKKYSDLIARAVVSNETVMKKLIWTILVPKLRTKLKSLGFIDSLFGPDADKTETFIQQLISDTKHRKVLISLFSKSLLLRANLAAVGTPERKAQDAAMQHIEDQISDHIEDFVNP